MGYFLQKGANFFINTYVAKHSPWILRAVDRDFYQCKKCGNKDVEKLVVHHIDGSRKKGHKNINNNLENLITLCKPCHAKMHDQSKSEYDFDKLKLLLKTGLFYGDIGKGLGISRQRISQLVKKYNLMEFSWVYQDK